jgi:ATP/maltotriose-dependent transcriptional regulator MalT
VALYQTLGDTLHIAGPLSKLALVKFAQGECTSARSLFEECVVRYREGTDKLDKIGLGFSLIGLGEVCKEQGEYIKACSYLEESLALARELGDDEGIIYALLKFARVLFVSLDAQAKVEALLEECLTRTTEMFEVWRVEARYLAGQIALSQRDVVRARPLLEESLAYSRSAGYRPDIAEALVDVGRVAAAQGDYVAAQAHYEESLALAKKLGFKRVIPASLEGMAIVVAAKGEPAWAGRLWGAAVALREAMGTLIPPVYRADYERSVAAARAQLDEKAFTAAWAEGRGMTWEQALAAREPVTLPSETQPTPPAKSPPTYPDGLTVREVEILRLLAQGLTDVHIADQLVISPRTVNTHLTSIYSKIQVSSRSAATRYAVEHRLV